jgi:hypothetical protein
MSIFSNILDKLGIHKAAAPSAPAAPTAAPAVAPARPAAPAMDTPNWTPRPNETVQPAAAPVAVAIPLVDVVTKLDALAKKSPIPLDWKLSIVDLLVLLGIDHSAATIQELAVELGCPASEMGDSTRRNIWLHKTVLQKIAENGGNIPANLLKK